MQSLAANAPRFWPGAEHVESWFLRANDPHSARAVWLKSTVLLGGSSGNVAEAWCSLFEEAGARAWRQTVPLAHAYMQGNSTQPLCLRIGRAELRLDEAAGFSRGSLASEQGAVAWELSFTREAGELGQPWCLLPSEGLIDAPLPRNKLLTPFPVARVSGWLDWAGRRWELRDWIGMQGHNWGSAHAPEYAWGHCAFWDAAGQPFAVVEGASGRLRLGGWTTPLLSLLSVRRAGREYRFDRLVDVWRQTPSLRFPAWTLRMSGACGEATLAMQADPRRMVCLGYDNPQGDRAYCLNSKTCAVTLSVRPVNEHAFECVSQHGGALEFLQPHPEPSVQPVV